MILSQLNHCVCARCDDSTSGVRSNVARPLSVLMRACGQRAALCAPSGDRGPGDGPTRPARSRRARRRPCPWRRRVPRFWPTAPQRQTTSDPVRVTPLGSGEARRAPARRFLALSLFGPKARAFHDTASASTHSERKMALSMLAAPSMALAMRAPVVRMQVDATVEAAAPPPLPLIKVRPKPTTHPFTRARAHTRKIMNAVLGSHSVLGCGIGLCSAGRLSHVAPRYSCACRRCALATRPLPVTCRLTR